MITYFRRDRRDKKLKKLDSFKAGCWINVVKPSKRDLSFLVKKLELDKRNLISGLDQNELPRLDVDADENERDLYIFTKNILKEPKLALQTYLIILSKEFILTFSEKEPDFIKDIREGNIEFVTTKKTKCLIKLFSLMNKEFEKSTMSVVKAVNIKKSLSSKLRERDVNNLLEQEDILNGFVSSYYHKHLLYKRLMKKIKFFEDDREIIEDLIVEMNQGFDLCKASLKSISNIRNYYLILLSNKLNRIITILTIFTVFISVPAAISGIYGMNIGLPLQDNPFAFSYVLVVLIVVWILLFLYFKKKDIM